MFLNLERKQIQHLLRVLEFNTDTVTKNVNRSDRRLDQALADYLDENNKLTNYFESLLEQD